MNLEELEARMEKAGETVGACLVKIRQDSMYLDAGYASFEVYCAERWGYAKSHAYRLIDHAKVAKVLVADGRIAPTEGQLRPAMVLKRNCKTEDEFIGKVVEVVAITQDRARKVHDVPRFTANDIAMTVADFGYSRPKQDIKPELREIKRLVLGINNSIAVRKGDGARFRKKHGDILSGAEVVYEWLRSYLEYGGE
jgi:hypothetical protein